MKKCLFIPLIFFASIVQAQNDYIESFDDYFLVRASLHNNSLNMSLSPRKNGITQFFKPLWYRPNVQNTIGLGASFKDLSLSVSFKLRQNSKINARQGDSKYSNIQLHSYGRKIGYDVYYQDFQGYFIENLDNLINGLFSGEALYQRDDLRIRNIATNVYYIFNPTKFSFRSAFVLDERQIRSGGSFILAGSLGYFRASADSSFIPADTQISFAPGAYLNSADFYTLSATPGYAYNFVFPKGFYLSLAASGLIGLQYHEGKSPILSDQGLNYFLKGIFRSSIGYNVRKWATGISFSTDIQGMNTQYVQFRSNNLDISFFVAHRIKTRWMAGKTTFFGFLKKKKKHPEEEGAKESL